VPADRPRFGLIVTLEDFWVANTFMHRDWYAPHDDESSIVVSAEELEHLVLLPAADITAKLTKLTTSAEVKGWHVGALMDGSDRRNPVIDSAWKALPWHAAFDAEQQHRSAGE